MLNLGESQLLLHIVFLNELGPHKKRVEKHWARPKICKTLEASVFKKLRSNILIPFVGYKFLQSRGSDLTNRQ